MEASRVFVIMDELGLGIVANIINHLLRIRSERHLGYFRIIFRVVRNLIWVRSEPNSDTF